MVRTRPGATLLACGAVCGLADWLRPVSLGFVRCPQAPRLSGLAPLQQQVLVARRVSTSIPESVPATKAADVKEPATAASPEKKSQEDIDDAVLQMAMAMSEEEASGTSTAATTPKKKEEGFDFNNVITFLLSALVFYSVGSSIISIVTGRIQDRTGGDFTLYDFFDNIFSFKEWSLEYSLGFDPFKVVEDLRKGSS
mmetsp:Transcript_66489/g.184093  ORF Transcript_66489/g.184093 Transcript_66489/m.184093 type:complete len:197 (+) Transcript_66489:52-642(+)